MKHLKLFVHVETKHLVLKSSLKLCKTMSSTVEAIDRNHHFMKHGYTESIT